MKKIKLVLSLFISVLAYNMQAQDKVESAMAPVMTFEKTVHDWGTINEGDTVETDFVFTNTGKTDLLITKIKGSCGCTVPSDWNKEPITPGTSSKFHVKFNSRGKPNKQQKTITITCNTAKGKEFVQIKAQVIPNPEQERLRAERAAKRKEEFEKRQLRESGATLKSPASPPAPPTPATAKNMEQENKELKKLNKELKESEKQAKEISKNKKKVEKQATKIEKELERAAKSSEKELKRAEKARKKTEKARKKTEKAAKKKQKLEAKVLKATAKVEKAENKLAKMKSKFERLQTKGKLSPNDVVDRELKMQKQVNKINKAKNKLQKIKRKL